MQLADAQAVYQRISRNQNLFNADIHCPLIIQIMADKDKGTLAHFCSRVEIGETKFYEWVNDNEIFELCYELGKMLARKAWEDLGMEIKDYTAPMGTISHLFEYWRLIGWSRFGISKNSRIRLNLKADDDPSKHYAQLIKQATKGEFTAGEIKQLMEAVNVGLNTHQVFGLQKQIDQLTSDLATMVENNNGHNPITNKGIAQKD